MNQIHAKANLIILEWMPPWGDALADRRQALRERYIHMLSQHQRSALKTIVHNALQATAEQRMHATAWADRRSDRLEWILEEIDRLSPNT